MPRIQGRALEVGCREAIMNDSGCTQDGVQDLKSEEAFLACMLRTDSSRVGKQRGKWKQLGWWYVRVSSDQVIRLMWGMF